MTGNLKNFQSITMKDLRRVTFGDNKKGTIIGIGKVQISSTLSIDEVYLVDGLKHNLLSISQLCDKGHKVVFNSTKCTIFEKGSSRTLFEGSRKENIYNITSAEVNLSSHHCLSSTTDKTWLWHRRLGHANMGNISKLSKGNLVNGLPKLNYVKDHICEACQHGKQIRSSFKLKEHVSTSRPLQLIHMDLFGPMRTESIGGKSYGYVLVDDHSRYTWVYFLSNKSDCFDSFRTFCLKVDNEKGYLITSIRSDHGR